MTNPECPPYAITIKWSPEDSKFIAIIRELGGVMGAALTHGDSYEEALKNGREVIDLLVESARADGDALPEPDYFEYERDTMRPKRLERPTSARRAS